MENAGSSRMHDCQTHDVSLKPWMSDSSEVNDQPKNVLNRQISEEENADKRTQFRNHIIKRMKTNITRHQLIDLLTDIQECSDDEKDSLVKLLPLKFYFRDTPFTSSTAHTLAQILPRLHGPVEELDLSRCKLNLDSLKIICEGTSKLKYKMEFLDVGGNELGDEEVKIISVVLNKVGELRLWDCGISATGLEVLCGEIKKLETPMESLDLSYNKFGDEGVKIISVILNKVGMLRLIGCEISEDGKQILREELKRLGLPVSSFVRFLVKL
uniref:NACHT, LRR and PYD domains-containing protein 1-like n=1 Tax=Phallusia mammillata TaxID=59560 RepID=A0A6F9DLP1_9ASCI|nr:NACHT, LRR and PYD domains-containing protein 1-like [Phallusia mammillata]